LKRPFVFLNSAMSADGKISTFERRQTMISGPDDISRVDGLRADSDAILVGIGTVLADDPGLRIRSESLRRDRLNKGLSENPLRVVADSMARTPVEATVLGPGCLIAVSRLAPEERLSWLSERCEIVKCGAERVDLSGLMLVLYERGIKRLMVEGGATLNWSLIAAGLVDELYVYIGNLLIGGKDAPTLIDGQGFSMDFPKLRLSSVERVDEGALLRWTVNRA
jgi:2,5-diamino-6-(ribosylamino)-4(3H)-pyrimidinone 5'-phosphate reductase